MEFINEDLLGKYPINLEIAKDQDEYITVPAHYFNNNYGTILCGFKLTDEDLEKINKDKCLYLSFQTFYKPLTPFKLLVGNKEVNEFVKNIGE